MPDNVKRLQRHKLHYCLVPSDDEQAAFWVAAEDAAPLEDRLAELEAENLHDEIREYLVCGVGCIFTLAGAALMTSLAYVFWGMGVDFFRVIQ